MIRQVTQLIFDRALAGCRRDVLSAVVYPRFIICIKASVVLGMSISLLFGTACHSALAESDVPGSDEYTQTEQLLEHSDSADGNNQQNLAAHPDTADEVRVSPHPETEPRLEDTADPDSATKPLPGQSEVLASEPIVSPTATADPELTAALAPTPTPTPTAELVATKAPKPTAAPAPTPTPKPTATPAATKAAKLTATPAPTPTPKPTATPAPTTTMKPESTSAATKATEPTVTTAPTPTPKPTATPAPADPTTQYWIDEVFRLTNLERTSRGLPALNNPGSRLLDAAAIRAEEISVKFSHQRPCGSSCFTVLDELNISYTAASENILMCTAGYYSPDDALAAWMNSPGHRDNILSEKYTTMGVGFYNCGKNHYLVQFFIRN